MNLHLFTKKTQINLVNSNFFTSRYMAEFILKSVFCCHFFTKAPQSCLPPPILHSRLTHSHKSSLNSLHASSVCHLPFLFPSHIPFSRSLYFDISCFHLHPLCNPLAILRLDPSLMSFHLLLFLSVSFSLFLAISKKIIKLFAFSLLSHFFNFSIPISHPCLCSIMLSLFPSPFLSSTLCASTLHSHLLPKPLSFPLRVLHRQLCHTSLHF